MVTKATKPTPSPWAPEAHDSRQPEIDAFIARNREVLNESLERSYEEAARGQYDTRTIDQIVAEGKRRHRARPAS